MQMLLTPDQESTLWHFSEAIILDNGTKILYFPYFLKMGATSGEYERLRFDQISEEVKDKLLIKQGIKLPAE